MAMFRVVALPGGRDATLKAVPQFAQNLAVSELFWPQFGHVMAIHTVRL
jgi:hypothetical protein